MAGTIQQPWTLGLVKSPEKEGQKQISYELLWRESRASSTYPYSKQKVTERSIWLDGFCNPPLACQELRGHGLLVSTDEEPCGHETHFDAPASTAFVALLRACAKKRDLHTGTRVHDDILRNGLLGKCSNALVTMYARCGALTKARELLHTQKNGSVVAWTALITAYVEHGQSQSALSCFEQMQLEGLSPDAVTFACILKACGSLKAAEKGEQIHDEICRQRLLEDNVVLGTAIVDMYAKCGALAKAQQVLEKLPFRDVIAWNALIAGYAQKGQGEQALICYEGMWRDGLTPNAVTFACILKACGSIGAIDKGEQIHNEIARQGLLGKEIMLGNALVDMYAKCGVLEKAKQVLQELPSRDVVTWNALIAGYAHHGQSEQALQCFEEMRCEGLSPNVVTFTCILKACGSMGAADKGEQIHDEIVSQGLLGNNIVLGTALVDMYVKCGALAKAWQALEELCTRDVVAWSVLITGYIQHGQAEQALNCFEQMQCEGLSPNEVTFACILKACASLGAVDKGEQIHDEIARQGLLENNLVLSTALVDMYAKSGALSKAQKLLEDFPSHDVVSWSALISGYAQQGQGEQSLSCFKQMQQEGVSPDAVTFSCVLNACSQLGLVEDGHMHFVDMSKKYGIKPDLEHYMCMVDLFGRAGHLDKAVAMIKEMPSSDSLAIWCALLGACQKWQDVHVGRWAFEQAVQIDKSDAAAYILMANIYAAAGMQGDAELIEAMRMEILACKGV